MKIFITLILLLSHNVLFGQIEVTITNLPNEYIIIMNVNEDYQEHGSMGTRIQVFQKNSMKKLIETKGHLSASDLDGIEKKATLYTIDYKKQEIVIIDDFNFDNKKDLAITTGNYSNYSLASYNIFLYKDGNFNLNASLSELATDYMGMFEVDKKNKLLKAEGKNGAFFHSWFEFSVNNKNEAQLMKSRFEEAEYFPFIQVTEQEFDSKQNKISDVSETRVKLKSKNWDGEEYTNVLFEFNLLSTNERVILAEVNNGNLFFGLIENYNLVKFNYPSFQEGEPVNINVYNQVNHISLEFTYENIRYEIYQSEEDKKIISLEFRISSDKGIQKFQGEIKTLKGNLRKLINQKFPNAKEK